MRNLYNRKENANHMNLVAMAQNVMGFVLLICKGFVPREENTDHFE